MWRPVDQHVLHRAARAQTSPRTAWTPATALAGVSLFVLAGAVVPVIRSPGATDVPDTDPMLQMMYGLVYIAVLAAMTPMLGAYLGRFAHDLHLGGLVALGFASFMWSTHPGLTLRRSVALLGATIVGVYFGRRFDHATQLKTLSAVFGAIVIASLAFALALPAFGTMPQDEFLTEGWRGVFLHKNILGRMMVLALLVFSLRLHTTRRRGVLALGSVIAAYLLIRSSSATAWALFVALSLFFLVLGRILRTARYRHPLVLLAASFGSLATYAVIQNVARLLEAVGRDPTLTGRLSLWQLTIGSIRDHPLVGHGYGAFWLTSEPGPAQQVARNAEWVVPIPHAHNGFLDLGLELGLVGVAVLAVGIYRSSGSALRLAASRRNDATLWPCLYIVLFVAFNVTESALVRHNDLFWALYVAAVVSLPVDVRRLPPSTARQA